MRRSLRLLFAPAWILATVVLVGSAIAQSAPSKVVSASQSACAETMRDVDRIACWVSAAPQPVPAGPKPEPALLRGSDGTTIIGPKPSQ